MTLQPSLFAAVPTPADAPDDAAWLAQVREDAGRWWRRWNVNERPALLLRPEHRGSLRWVCWHPASSDIIGGVWPDYDAAILWRALALGICSWKLQPDIEMALWGDALDAAEARLRRVLGVTA